MRKGFFYLIFVIVLTAGVIIWSIMQSRSFNNPYTQDVDISGDMKGLATTALPGYSSKYAVIPNKEEINADAFKDSTYATIMVNNETKECIVAHNVHERIYPASMTKLLTGIVVCDAIEAGEIQMDEVIELDHNITFDDSDAVQSALTAGCKISVRNLLTALMLSSYNDYAIVLAERISGSVEKFAERMNEKARSIGATNTHFTNPHGLDDLDHYTTAYDMYLIVNCAAECELLHEIDGYKDYTYTWEDAAGNTWDDTASATNHFISESGTLPSNISIQAWKTGTTTGAGNCLTMQVKINDVSYTMMVSDMISKDDLYEKYGKLFNMAR